MLTISSSRKKQWQNDIINLMRAEKHYKSKGKTMHFLILIIPIQCNKIKDIGSFHDSSADKFD